MKTILINEQEGSVNFEGIDDYIAKYGVNAGYYNPDSEYNGCTLLSAAIRLPGVDPDLKMDLISYLLSKNPGIRSIIKGNSLIGAALANDMPSLADLLLRAGADIDDEFNNQNVLDIALASRNEKNLLWVLNNAKEVLLFTNRDEFKRYLQKIEGHYSEEVQDAFNKIKQEYSARNKAVTVGRFDKIGMITADEAAVVLAAKMSKKPRPNSIFVITDKDIKAMTEGIKNLIQNETEEKIIKFQIIHFPFAHAIYGEFRIDKTTEPATVRYLHLDPAPHLTKYSQIVTPDFIKEIAPLANIEVYDSNVILQKGLGCSFFSLDGAMLLSTPSKPSERDTTPRDYVVDVIEHFQNYGKEKDEEENIRYFESDTLPIRFLRGLQHITEKEKLTGLETSIFNASEMNQVINKKGETGEASIKKELKQTANKVLNTRMENKMKKYQQEVKAFLRDKNIFSPEFEANINQYKIAGLKEFCQQQFKQTKKHGI